MLTLIVMGAAGVFCLWLVGSFIVSYHNATGTAWQRAFTAAKGSATILWNGAVAAASAFLLLCSEAADAFNWPEVKTLIAQIPAQYVATAGLIIAGIGVVARLRTLQSKS